MNSDLLLDCCIETVVQINFFSVQRSYQTNYNRTYTEVWSVAFAAGVIAFDIIIKEMEIVFKFLVEMHLLQKGRKILTSG